MQRPLAASGTGPNGSALAPHDARPSTSLWLPVPTANPTETVPGFDGNLHA